MSIDLAIRKAIDTAVIDGIWPMLTKEDRRRWIDGIASGRPVTPPSLNRKLPTTTSQGPCAICHTMHTRYGQHGQPICITCQTTRGTS